MEELPLAYSYIRLSTEPQTRGHGRQRQLEQSAAYAREHGLRLVPFEDVLSAFRGANLREGALGRFLDRVRAGLITKGSYLLVESLDRISREEVRKSFRVFLDIVDAGINVVTLQDKRIYRANEMTFEVCVLLLSFFSRGHNESYTKSDRQLKNWASKRANLQEKKLTALCPAWLKLNADGKSYAVIDERAAVVLRIFQDTANGIGTHTLQRRLNNPQSGTPPFGKAKSKRWHRSYIMKILTNRAVLGEFQPCKMVGKKREPTGEVQKSYFPRIIDDDLFNRARQSRKNRQIRGRGRKGDYFTNLFSGVVSCWYCRSRMTIANKGPSPKGGRYLVCPAGKGGGGCVATAWRYDHFELSFLEFIEQLNLPNLLGESDPERKKLDETLQALGAEQFAVKEDLEIAWEGRRQKESRYLGEKIFELEQRSKELEEHLRQIKAEIETHELKRCAFKEGRAQIKIAIERVRDQSRKRDDLYEDRALVADRIKAIADDIEIATEGATPLMEGRITDINPKRENSERRGMFTERRFFLVTFKDDGHSTLGVIPPDDPFDIEQYQFFDTGDPWSVT